MGTPLIPPEAGDACALCWGLPGSEFGAGDTPLQITLSISGVQKGSGWAPFFGEPINGTFLLIQSNDCVWAWDGSSIVFWQFVGSFTSCNARSLTGFMSYTNSLVGQCLTTMPNAFTDPSGAFFGGTGTISF